MNKSDMIINDKLQQAAEQNARAKLAAPDVVLAFTQHPDKFRSARSRNFTVEDRSVQSINRAVIDASEFVIAKDERLAN